MSERIIAQGIRVIMIAPALRRKQNACADQRRKIMHDIFLPARIAQLRHHPLHDPAALKYLTKNHCPGITGQPIRPMFDAKRLVETRRDWF